MTTMGRLGPTGSFMALGPPKAGVMLEKFQSKSQGKTLPRIVRVGIFLRG